VLILTVPVLILTVPVLSVDTVGYTAWQSAATYR